MLPRAYENQRCSVARTLEVVGDRWTVLVLRDVFLGLRRFDDVQRELGIARNVLADRLARLVEEGILERRRYQERPERFEYHLTEKGIDLWPSLMALMRWGDKHAAPAGPPRLIEHRGCGGGLTDQLTCDRCGEPMNARTVQSRTGPGALVA